MKRLLLFLASLYLGCRKHHRFPSGNHTGKNQPERDLHHRHSHRVAAVCLREQEQRVGRILDRSRGNIDLAVDLEKAQQANQA